LSVADLTMDEEKRIKMAAISGAAHALKYKNKNPRATEDEILQYISNEVHEIVQKIDQEI